MRILVINYEYPPIGGGGGFVTRDIYEHIASLGHRVTVVTSCAEGLERHEIRNGVEIVRVPVFLRKKTEVASLPSMLSYVPSSVLATAMRFGPGDYDIVNTHFAIPSGPAGHALSKIFRIPNVLSIHGGDIFDPSKPLSPHKTPVLSNIVEAVINRADRVVAQSNDTRRNARRYYRIRREIDIIPLGIKRPVFEKKRRADFGLRGEDIVLCTIGRLVKRKNLQDAIRMLERAGGRYPLRLVIIGDGPEHAHIRELANSLRLNGSVRFMGNVPDDTKFQLLDLSDLYLSTASHEGFGLVFLEAMACGLPVICYNRGGQNDFMVDGKTGFLVDLGDERALLERTLTLIENPALKRSMGSFNRELVKKYYISSCGEKYLSLFEEVLSGQGRARGSLWRKSA